MASRAKVAAPKSRKPAAKAAQAAKAGKQLAGEWWKSYFDAQYMLEYEPIFTLENDRRDVSRLIEVMELPTDAHILDVPCGQGRHAHLLAENGFDVTGLDYSAHLLQRAKARGTGTHLRYVRGDMRAMPAAWTGKFDAVLNLFTSFGFFTHPADDAKVIREFARVLKPGGTLLWHGGSRDGVVARFLTRDWWTADDGTMVGHERSFDPLSGFLTVRTTVQQGSGSFERTHQIRLYTATRLAELCAAAGLVVEQAWDGWRDRPLNRKSSEMLLLARKEG
jgi:ubiquinone/menaquinone biosynthesis C-methylase UbiE